MVAAWPPRDDPNSPQDAQLRAIQERVDEAVRRAQVADGIMAQPLIQEARMQWEAAIDRGWKASTAEQAEFREQLYHAYKAGEKFWGYLQGVSLTGKASAKTAAETLGLGSSSSDRTT